MDIDELISSKLVASKPIFLKFQPQNWRERLWMGIIEMWYPLIYGKASYDIIDGIYAKLLNEQPQQEKYYLDNVVDSPKIAALELIGLYYLSKAAKILSLFISCGIVDGDGSIYEVMGKYFKNALTACKSNHISHYELKKTIEFIQPLAFRIIATDKFLKKY